MNRLKKTYTRITDKVGKKLSDGLSTMEMFYIVAFLVICPLAVQRPDSLISWIQYISTAVLQAVALPLLGYTTKKSGDAQEKIIRETRELLMKELSELKDMHEDLHSMVTEFKQIKKDS